MELSAKRAWRLAELRAKYPKQEPQPPEPEQHSAYLTISLRFDFQVMTQEEAEKAAFHFMWHQGYEICEMLHKHFAKDGLRDVSLIQEIKGSASETHSN